MMKNDELFLYIIPLPLFFRALVSLKQKHLFWQSMSRFYWIKLKFNKATATVIEIYLSGNLLENPTFLSEFLHYINEFHAFFYY